MSYRIVTRLVSLAVASIVTCSDTSAQSLAAYWTSDRARIDSALRELAGTANELQLTYPIARSILRDLETTDLTDHEILDGMVEYCPDEPLPGGDLISIIGGATPTEALNLVAKRYNIDPQYLDSNEFATAYGAVQRIRDRASCRGTLYSVFIDRQHSKPIALLGRDDRTGEPLQMLTVRVEDAYALYDLASDRRALFDAMRHDRSFALYALDDVVADSLHDADRRRWNSVNYERLASFAETVGSSPLDSSRFVRFLVDSVVSVRQSPTRGIASTFDVSEHEIDSEELQQAIAIAFSIRNANVSRRDHELYRLIHHHDGALSVIALIVRNKNTGLLEVNWLEAEESTDSAPWILDIPTTHWEQCDCDDIWRDLETEEYRRAPSTYELVTGINPRHPAPADD